MPFLDSFSVCRPDFGWVTYISPLIFSLTFLDPHVYTHHCCRHYWWYFYQLGSALFTLTTGFVIISVQLYSHLPLVSLLLTSLYRLILTTLIPTYFDNALPICISHELFISIHTVVGCYRSDRQVYYYTDTCSFCYTLTTFYFVYFCLQKCMQVSLI